MRKRRSNGEVRVIIGSGYLAGDKDISEAGPIPKSAGVTVKPRASSDKPEARANSADPREDS